VEGKVETCGSDGFVASIEACAAGCAGSEARCKHIVPAWLPAACDQRAAQVNRTLTGTLVTDDNTACDEVVVQSGGPEVCIVAARTLQVADLKVIGARAVGFVADTIDVTGVLDLSADGQRSGPGAGPESGEHFEGDPSGGGGAGFRQAGGDGGARTPMVAAKGGAIRDPLAASIFTGGSSGAEGGGGGGGALLIACRGEIRVTGQIDGGGGAGVSGVEGISGTGGGAGGYVVIQGARVTVTGTIVVNGGGGGAACDAPPATCTPGVDALGPGGQSGVGGTGVANGGAGGAGDVVPGAGKFRFCAPQLGCSIGGGGGGAVGRVQVYTPADMGPTLTPSAVFEPSLTIPTR
jgi:hypothetical protein